MKNKKILGLGICALSLGMVAGVIGTRAAVEAKAAASHTWALCGAFGGAAWANDVETLSYDDGTKVHTLQKSLKAGDTFKIRADADWALQASWQFADMYGNNEVLGKDGSGNLVAVIDGIYTLSIKDSATESDLEWDKDLNYQKFISVNVAAYEYDYRIVGAFSGEETSWDYATSVASETKKDGNLYQYSGITLAANDEFKIATVNDTLATVDWDRQQYAYGDILTAEGDAHAKFEEGVDKESKPNGNIKAKEAGTYDIYVNSSGKIYIFDTAEPITYTAKLGEAAIALEEVEPGEGMEKQLHGKITAAKNAEVTVYADAALIVFNISSSANSSVVYDKNGIFKVHNDVENADIYIKIMENGNIEIWASAYQQGPTGWYICNASTWGPADGKLSEGSNAQNVAFWLDVNMAADYEFTIAEFLDGERVAQYDLGWSDVAEAWSSEYAKFEAGASDNHIKVKTAGVYSVYVTAGETKKICLNGTGLTPEVIQKAKDLHSYVSAAGAEDYTETPAELRNKSCADKCAAALEDYNDLGEAGQKYFRDNYADDYAIMEYWHNKTANPSSLYKVSGLAGSNPTLIITLSVIAGAAVAGAGIYLISKKRKHN